MTLRTSNFLPVLSLSSARSQPVCAFAWMSGSRSGSRLSNRIVSPSNTRAEIREKVLEYLAAGTRLVWVVEPRTRSVTTYRSRTDVKVLKGTDLLSGLDVLPGFRLSLNELFTPPVFPEG